VSDAVRTPLGETWPARSILTALQDTGEVFLLFGQVLREIPAGLRKLGLIVEQMAAIGIGSIPLTLIVALFTGAVAAVQAAYQMRDYVPMIYLGTVIGKSVVIELGPVLTAIVVGGRVGASVAAELLHYASDNLLELIHQRAAVRIAQRQIARAATLRRRQRLQRIFRV
jgi:hypothetical protein